MGKKIVSLWVEIHYTDAENTPQELLDWTMSVLQGDAQQEGARLIVIRTNAFQEPEPEPGGSDEGSNPIPTDGGDSGGPN